MGGDCQFSGAFHNVIVGNNVAVIGQNKAGAGGSAGGGIAVNAGGGHRRGNGDHAVHAGSVELAGRHGAAVGGHQRALAGGGAACDLLLQDIDLLRQGLFPGFPALIYHGGGDSAAAGHQRNCQHTGKDGLPEGFVGLLRLMRMGRGGCLRGMETFLCLMVHFIGGVGVGGFLPPGTRSVIHAVIGRILGRFGGFFRIDLRFVFKFVVFKGFHNGCLLICFLDIKHTAHL